uniref:Uncharacterized protein n=1 Tax=Picea sitchensis TaxID=3332 RepID=A9NSN1_PICSI|nr:unknown [Picea sitchensis]
MKFCDNEQWEHIFKYRIFPLILVKKIIIHVMMS